MNTDTYLWQSTYNSSPTIPFTISKNRVFRRYQFIIVVIDLVKKTFKEYLFVIHLRNKNTWFVRNFIWRFHYWMSAIIIIWRTYFLRWWTIYCRYFCGHVQKKLIDLSTDIVSDKKQQITIEWKRIPFSHPINITREGDHSKWIMLIHLCCFQVF